LNRVEPQRQDSRIWKYGNGRPLIEVSDPQDSVLEPDVRGADPTAAARLRPDHQSHARKQASAAARYTGVARLWRLRGSRGRPGTASAVDTHRRRCGARSNADVVRCSSTTHRVCATGARLLALAARHPRNVGRFDRGRSGEPTHPAVRQVSRNRRQLIVNRISLKPTFRRGQTASN